MVALGVRFGLGTLSLALLVVPVVVALWYLAEYDRRPMAQPNPPVTATPAETEEFDDPVLEADRLESEGGGPPTESAAGPPEAAPPEPALGPGAVDGPGAG
ncbi:MAG: hypothetical protein L3K09_05150 [Thermoplasmata archaeon]|nr:hypothetical protein [Thermoplasmata archaeon]